MSQDERTALWSAVKEYVEAEAEVLFLRRTDQQPDVAVGNRYAHAARVLAERLRRAANRRADARQGIAWESEA